jgi:uncharacterized membrane protein
MIKSLGMIRICRVCALCAALSVGLAFTVRAKSYSITNVDIDARLSADGGMEVTEMRTYAFRGSFSYAFRYMPRGGPAAFEGFQILEDGRPYKLSDSGAPGTYSVEKSGDRITVTWHYAAKDESRTFEFRYRAPSAIERYDDAAVLYYKFLSEDWDMPQNNISLRVVPPQPVSRGRLNEWLHGPLWAESRITDDGVILGRCARLPAHQYLELRALYPPQIFPEVPESPGAVREEIMAEEAQWVEEANRARLEARERIEARKERREIGKWIVIVLALAGFFTWWRIYRAYGKRPALPTFLDMTSEVPGKTPPALVGYLLHNRQVTGAGLVGTMLDLARRGFVELREEKVEKKGFWGGAKEVSEYYWDVKRARWREHRSELLEFENSLLEFIFDDLAEGQDSISLEAVKKKRRDFVKFFRKWRKTVSELGEQQEWFDKASIRGSYYSVALGVGMMLLAVGAGFLFGAWAVVLAAAGILVLILSFLIYHRTAKGETEARHWNALNKYLRTYEFRSQTRSDLLSRVSDYLVYGVVLGLSTKFYSELAAAIPEGEHAVYVPWYIYHGVGQAGFSPEAFGAAFSSMVSTATSTMSTASGAGGGASGGGGGGAGSGGGGAG